MAETPFSPESGAASGGTAPQEETPGMPGQAGEAVSPEPEAVAPGAGSVEPNPEPIPPAVAPVEPAPPAASEPLDAVSTEASVVAAEVSPTDAEPTAQAPEPSAQAPEPVAQPPGVAATIAVPPLEQGEQDGGEWELLRERLGAFWNSGELNRQWQRIRGPLKGVAILVAVLLALQVYATVVRTIDGIPLVSGLLELTGLIAVLQFSVRRLLRSQDRQEVLEQLQRRWLEFRGRG